MATMTVEEVKTAFPSCEEAECNLVTSTPPSFRTTPARC